MAKRLSYQVIEDNGGKLHLAVFNGEECIWFASGYEYIPDNLQEDIAALHSGRHPLQEGWEYYLPEGYTPQKLYDELTSHKHSWKIIADESATYPERMGVAGRMVFGLDDVYEEVMNLKEKAMRQDARGRIIECLKDGFNGYYCDLHHRVFNTGYYIIGTERAKEALKEYDVFEAIKRVLTYEKENFGELYTDLSDPEKLINALHYIIGEEVLHEMLDASETWANNWNNRADEETNAKILEELGE